MISHFSLNLNLNSLPRLDIAVLGVVGEVPGHRLVALAAEGVVLPGLHGDMIPLGVDHGWRPLHIADTAAGRDGRGGQGREDGEDDPDHD